MHHSYIIPALVDAEVVHKQAYKRLHDIKHPEETWVHYHRRHEPCNVKCVHYDPLKTDKGSPR